MIRSGDGEESSDEDDVPAVKKGKKKTGRGDVDIGKVVCVEVTDKKKSKDNWFPALIVTPSAQETVKIRTKDEYLVRSFRDGR
jgi:Ras-related protein Rab-1A